ncbi:hypothetical protein LCGC14_1667770 [marine sediment metagenome]|uniref:tRNA-guanine(15) transglycosylase-like domain-containing protein n=1 Tax=marine sediment metagenome TaxID=412755 RepID=A0A0F9K804_9ZZZZ
MKWEISDIDALGRLGKLTLNDKQMITPNLFPVIHPYKNIVSISDLKKIGTQCLFTNAYIIYQNNQLRDDILKKGIHNYLNFDGIIATDSGAFQKYIYNKDNLEINANDIEKFQEDIGSDFSVILDEPVQPDDDYETAKKKIFTTIQRAKENIIRRKSDTSHWFGPIHGNKYLDLLKICTIEMSKLDFRVFAVGGLVKLFLNYRFDLVIKVLLNVKKNIVPNKPIHMFGLGLPQFFSLAVTCGCDLMDSAAYVLYAKENRYFTLSTGTRKLEELEEFPCHCPICCKYKPKEVKNFDDELRIELLAKHNLYLSFSELRTIRQAIKEGNLWELVEQRIRNHPNLVNAAKIIKSNLPFFEVHEKLFKTHGRLYSSPESVNRPLFHRYELKIKNNYRVPKEAKFLILLPELDVKGVQSPSIKNWLGEIDNNSLIPRKFLHVSFISVFYGIIPLELSYTFPMGQYESIDFSESDNILIHNIIEKIENFFNFHSQYYFKCGILVPVNYINQFNEIVEFSKKNLILRLVVMLKSKFKLNISTFKDISQLLHYFSNERE